MPGKTAAIGGKWWPLSGFNEAPAKCRGKLHFAFTSQGCNMASMRPQRNAGENLASGSQLSSSRRLQ